MKKRILISAGDPSGDMLLSRIIENIKSFEGAQNYEFVGLAGPLCEAKGAKILVPSKEVAVVGIFEVIKKLPVIFGALKTLERELENVDSVLCVDFPDFNMKLSNLARKKGVPVDYVVAPQVWAWRQGRVAQFKDLVRRLYPVLPFEEEIFRDQGVDAKFLGHPIRDALPPRDRKGARSHFALKEDQFAMCMMPGSRTGELSRHLPLLMDSWEMLKQLRQDRQLKQEMQVLWALAKGWTLENAYDTLKEKEAKRLRDLVESGEWKPVYQAHMAMMASDFAWIVSGTATLEAAYYQLPHILLYKLSPLSVMVLMQMSSYFRDTDAKAGLANILLGKKVIPELLQHNLTPKRLVYESLEYLDGKMPIENIRKSLRFLPKHLGQPGATKRIAEDLFKLWKVEP